MKKYISLSKYPGKTGQHFYNNFFKHYNIDATYEPRGTDDIDASIKQAREEVVAGISVSMPFKQSVIQYLDDVDPNVSTYNSCNTIKVENGRYIGYNADIAGVEYIRTLLSYHDRVTILGTGAIGRMFIRYLESNNFEKLNVCSRSLGNWNRRLNATDVIINCTALGTSTTDSPFDNLPKDVRLVVDLAINDNELKNQCEYNDIKYVSGKEFYQAQFVKQFEIYTGIVVDKEIYKNIERMQYETI